MFCTLESFNIAAETTLRQLYGLHRSTLLFAEPWHMLQLLQYVTSICIKQQPLCKGLPDEFPLTVVELYRVATTLQYYSLISGHDPA